MCIDFRTKKKPQPNKRESLQQRSRNELAGGTSVIGARGADEDEQLNETEELPLMSFLSVALRMVALLLMI